MLGVQVRTSFTNCTVLRILTRGTDELCYILLRFIFLRNVFTHIYKTSPVIGYDEITAIGFSFIFVRQTNCM